MKRAQGNRLQKNGKAFRGTADEAIGRAVDATLTNFQEATLRRTAALVGATLESMQLWDILRAIEYLVDGEGLKLEGISLYGRKHMGALALYAAALDDRVSRVILDDPPSSHWDGPALLNVLKITDLPEAAAIMAPREIVMLSSIPKAYAYTESVYALYGQGERIRTAGGLAAALKVWEG